MAKRLTIESDEGVEVYVWKEARASSRNMALMCRNARPPSK